MWLAMWLACRWECCLVAFDPDREKFSGGEFERNAY